MAVVSSCREMLGQVPQRAQPSSCVTSGSAGDSQETARDKREEGGDDVKSARPLRPGPHTCYNGSDSALQPREGELIAKSYLSSDSTLQLECLKLESLVIVGQHTTVNTFPGLVHTARHTMGVGFT